MGAQRRTKAVYCNNGTFQSTYPVQGTPPPISGRRLKTSSFNPRAPCGAGRKWGGIPTGITQFQSTHPVGARQQRADICGHPLRISIHAPRRARRQMARRSTSLSMDFNPPAPCGAGHRRGLCADLIAQFQSTCPVWGRTQIYKYVRDPKEISIHLPHVGQDVQRPRRKCTPAAFQSTCPMWGRTSPTRLPGRTTTHFNPPAPCGAGQHKFTKNSLVIYATQTNRSVCVRSWQNSICTVLP